MPSNMHKKLLHAILPVMILIIALIIIQVLTSASG